MDGDGFFVVEAAFFDCPIVGRRKQVGDAIGHFDHGDFGWLLEDTLQAIAHLFGAFEGFVFCECCDTIGDALIEDGEQLFVCDVGIFYGIVQDGALHGEFLVAFWLGAKGCNDFHGHEAEMPDIGDLFAWDGLSLVDV